MQQIQPSNNKSELKISFYKKLSRKKWFQIARPIIITLIFLLLIYLLTILGVFKIKKIEIKEDLEYVQDISEVSNQYIGQGYFSLNLVELEEDVKKSDKYIKQISAQKIFPNKIYLVIEEYEPMSYLEYKETCYIFSQEGLILEQEVEYEKCIIENGIELTSNQNVIADNRLIFDKELLDIVTILKEFGWKVLLVNFRENVLEVSDGEKTIIIEINQEYEKQLSKLYLVLEKVNIEGIEYKSLDLRFERPVMKVE